MTIPFFRAQGAGNDFLFTWRDELPPALTNPDFPALARALCHRNFGVGADGWYVIDKSVRADASIHLYNSDGSQAELSGNGTRCAAAVLIHRAMAAGPEIRIHTGAGERTLLLISRTGYEYQFEMAMGSPNVLETHFALPLRRGATDAALIDVGNPQCSIDIRALDETGFDFDWQSLGAEIEGHPMFPRRTNVSFFSKLDGNILDARFFERGAGATLSSGTGATGVAAAARARGLVEERATIRTQAGDLDVRWNGADLFLTGSSKVIARGEFYLDEKSGSTADPLKENGA